MKLGMVCLVLAVMVAGARGAAPQRAYPAEGSYAVVTSGETEKQHVDTVAFYGDPAWMALWPPDDKAFSWTVERQAESFEIKVRILKDGKWERPLLVPLKERVAQVKSVECSVDAAPVFTDNFLLLPVAGQERKQGDVVTLDFEGTMTIVALYVDGERQSAGTYSSTNLGKHIRGSGTIKTL